MPDRVPRERCGAAPRAGGTRTEPCRAWPIVGSKRCRSHGGAAPQTRRAAAIRVAESKLNALVDKLAPRPVTDPFTELAALAGEVIQWKDVLATKVAELNEYAYRHDAGEQIRGHVVLFERGLDRCASVLSTIAKLDIDRRIAAIGDDQADRIADAFLAAVEQLDIPVDSPLRTQLANLFRDKLTADT